jgi:hypothetical protein
MMFERELIGRLEANAMGTYVNESVRGDDIRSRVSQNRRERVRQIAPLAKDQMVGAVSSMQVFSLLSH